MGETKTLICVTCPKGCKAKVSSEEGVIKVKGKICKKGKGHLEQEYLEPMRILTSTVVMKNSRLGRLPVRTVKPIPKRDLFKAMDHISRVTVKPPIRMREVIISNLVDSGIDLIATDDAFE